VSHFRIFVYQIVMDMGKNVALVLSSGGPRGFAYIGAIEELLSRGYNITSVAGTSMGSLIGGIYSAGKLPEAKEWFMSLDAWKVFKLMDLAIGRNHVVKGEKVIDALEKIVPDVNIEDLGIPFRCVATDLYTGEEVVFDKGSLFKAIRASISIPALFRPVQYGMRTLIDGGVVNSIPLNRVVRHEGDILVGFNVNDIDKNLIREKLTQTATVRARKAGRPGEIKEVLESALHSNGPIADRLKAVEAAGLPIVRAALKDNDFEELELGGNYYTLLDRTFDLMNHRNTQLSIQMTPPDVLVNMPFDTYGAIADYAKVKEISDRGRKLMAEALDAFEAGRK